MSISQLTSLPSIPFQSFSFSKDLQQYLSGRKLLKDELPFSLALLQQHYDHGYLQLHKGVINEQGTYRCSRCNESSLQQFFTYHCLRCHQNCTYCRTCIKMGKVSTCTPLFSWSGPAPVFIANQTSFAWNGMLSPAQQHASKHVSHACEHRKNILIWAVCGAGKTEILYEGLYQALQKGKRICIAAPRRDVVMELSPRLKAAFPTTSIATLHGESNEKHEYAQLILATTHQLLRFYHAFDWMIVDEVDAFPFSFDYTLQYAVEQARKKESGCIYLTATPSLQQKKTIETCRVLARYHGHPLPEPRFVWCGNWRKILSKGKLPSSIQRWLEQHEKKKSSLFLFVPTIADIPLFLQVVSKQYAISIEGVHAEDKERSEKVIRFREGKTKWLITTTILERGVTIANSHVAVIGAEHSVFTESGLVQIAGRVGRNKQYPTGEVIYFHYGKTEAMMQAKKQIVSCNKEAKKTGVLL